jgi:3-oxoacyl-[acyl-carrier protein] reductase
VRNILITGGNGGLGLAIGRHFLEHDAGAHVWLGVRENRAAAEALAAAFPERVRLIPLDVTEPAAWEAAIAGMIEEGGRIDILVNNAGMHKDCLLASMPAETWHRVIASNLDSVFHGCRACVTPMMRQRFGRIINIASLSALMPPLGQTNYAAAKAGVVTFSQALAKEVARAGITVNAVLPGYIETEALASIDDEAKKQARATIPMRRFGKPEEVAAAVFFLASPQAAYITGASLKIDGGIF